MNEEIWEILGIEKTKDEEAIINAYRAKVVTVNPEDDQEGFMKLRAAFEAAREYAAKGDEEENSEEDSVRYNDNDEIDRAIKEHISKLDAIYCDMNTRLDTSIWKEWLNADICKNIDSVDSMAEAMLVFLMRNNFLPFEIWQMIAETFDFFNNKDHILKKFRSDYIEFIQIHCTKDDCGDYQDYVERDVYLDLFSDIISEISVYREKQLYTPVNYFFKDDEYINNMQNIQGYFNSYFDNYLYYEKTKDQEYKDGMETCLTYISNILEICDKSSLFIPVELGARILYLELEEKFDLSLRLSMAVFDRWKDVHFYATNNAIKIILKNIDKIEDKDEIVKKIIEKVEKIEELHPDYVSTKKVRFALLMLDKKYKEAEEKIKEVLNVNNNDLEAVILFRIVTAKETEAFKEALKEGNVSDKEKMDAVWRYYQNLDIDNALNLLKKIVPNPEIFFDYNKLFGICYSEKKQFGYAEPYLKKWVELHEELLSKKDSLNEEDLKRIKNVSACYSRYGICLYETGKPEEAEKYFTKDLKFENVEDKLRYRESYGTFLVKSNRFNDAMKVWDELINEPTLSLVGYIHRQETAYKMKKAQLVIDDYYEILNRYKRYSKAYYYAASVFCIYEQYEEADKIIKTAEENNVNTDLISLIKARLLYLTEKEHEYDKNIGELYEEIFNNIELSKKNDDYNSDAEDELLTVYGDAADYYLQVVDEHGAFSKLDLAEKYIEKGCELEPFAWRFLYQDVVLAKNKGLDADDSYKNLIDAFRDYPKPYYLYAEYLNDRNNKKEALKMYEKVYDLDPEYPEINNRLMHCYMEKYSDSRKKRDKLFYNRAVEHATKQIELDPDAYYYLERGWVYFGAGDFDLAIRDALHCIDEEPENGYAYNLLGKAYYDKKEYDNSIAALEKAIELLRDKKNFAAYNNIVKALETVGRYDEALKYLDQKAEKFNTKKNDRNIYLRLYKKNNDKAKVLDITDLIIIDVLNEDGYKNYNAEHVISSFITVIDTFIMYNDINAVKLYEKNMMKYLKKIDFSIDGKHRGIDSKLKCKIDNDTVLNLLDNLGRFYLFEKRDYKSAIKCFESWLNLDDKKKIRTNRRAVIYKNLSQALYRRGKHNEGNVIARLALDDILEVYSDYSRYINDPEEAPFRLNVLAKLLYFANKKNEAYDLLLKVDNCICCDFCHCKRCYDKLLVLADFSEFEGRTEEAISYLKDALEIAPDDSEIRPSLRHLGVKDI